MFRDLKEYQEIAKIYADKVSKPEDLEERVKGGGVATNPVKPFEKPAPQVSGNRGNRPKMKGGITFEKPTVQGAQGRTKSPKPDVKKEPEYKPKPGVVFGQRTNEIGAQGGGKPSEGDFKKDFPDKNKKPKMGSPDSKFIKRDKGVGFVKRGTPMAQRAENKERQRQRTKEMFKKRQEDKAAGKPQLSGKERAQQMAKERIAAKQAEMKEGSVLQSYIKPTMPLLKDKSCNFYTTDGKPFDMEKFKDNYNKKKNKTDKTDIKSSYEYDAYDLVLEYLLSTEQVATIEEANYVMTEMDAETIQGIVEEQKKNLEEGLPLLAKGAAIVGGAILAKKGLDKAKKSFDNYIDNERDKPGGGNTRPGADKIYFGDKKKK